MLPGTRSLNFTFSQSSRSLLVPPSKYGKISSYFPSSISRGLSPQRFLATSSTFLVRKSPPKPPAWMDKYIINTKVGQFTERKLTELCDKADPELNRKRLEIYYGILETFETSNLVYKQYVRPHSSSFNYEELMQIDRFKREIGKIFIAFSPFMFIPFSFIWYFPVLLGLGYYFPKFIMPAHYMRGKNSRLYYRGVHNFRKKSYPVVINYLHEMDQKYITHPVVQKILPEIQLGKIPEIEDLKQLQEYLKKEPRLSFVNVDKDLIRTYSKTLLRWTYFIPMFSERNLKKRMQSIIYLDNILRQPGMLDSLDAGQLREAVYIRGCNGYEASRDMEANKYWLEKWLELTSHIDPITFRYHEHEMCYFAMVSVLWSINFTQANFERHVGF